MPPPRNGISRPFEEERTRPRHYQADEKVVEQHRRCTGEEDPYFLVRRRCLTDLRTRIVAQECLREGEVLRYSDVSAPDEEAGYAGVEQEGEEEDLLLDV